MAPARGDRINGDFEYLINGSARRALNRAGIRSRRAPRDHALLFFSFFFSHVSFFYLRTISAKSICNRDTEGSTIVCDLRL